MILIKFEIYTDNKRFYVRVSKNLVQVISIKKNISIIIINISIEILTKFKSDLKTISKYFALRLFNEMIECIKNQIEILKILKYLSRNSGKVKIRIK
jgi:hypothetical protein